MNIIVKAVTNVGMKVTGKRTNKLPKIPQGCGLVAVIHKGSEDVLEDVTYLAKYMGCHIKDCCGTHRMDLYILSHYQMRLCGIGPCQHSKR